MQCEELESRFLQVYWTVLPFIFFLHPSLTEDQFSTQKALQTVVAGQQAENLLYVDYDAISIESPSWFHSSQRFRRFHQLGRSAIRPGRDTGIVADSCSGKPHCWDVKQPPGRPRFYFWRRRQLDATLGHANVSFRRRRLHDCGPTNTTTWPHPSKTQLAAATATARWFTGVVLDLLHFERCVNLISLFFLVLWINLKFIFAGALNPADLSSLARWRSCC